MGFKDPQYLKTNDSGLSKASANPTSGCVKQGYLSLPVTEPADYISAVLRVARPETK